MLSFIRTFAANIAAALTIRRNPTVTRRDWGSEFGYAPATQEELDAWNDGVQRRNTRAEWLRENTRRVRAQAKWLKRVGYGAR